MVFRVCATGCVLSLVAAAAGQSSSSFAQVEGLDGLSVTQQGPLTYTVSLSSDPVLVYQSQEIPITDVFGFWAIDPDNDVTGTTTSFGVWDAHGNNAGPGGILGWRTNPNTGITPGGSQPFTFDSLAPTFEFFGFHIRVDGTFPGTTGNTGFVFVPSPAPAGALGLAGLFAARRRRRLSPR